MHAGWSAAGPSSRSSEPSREREGRGARDAARLGLATEATNTASAPAQSASDSLATRQPPARKRDIEVDQFLDDLAADLIDRGGGRRRHCSRRSMSPAQPIRFCWDSAELLAPAALDSSDPVPGGRKGSTAASS